MWGNSSHVPTSDSTKYTIRKEAVCVLSLFNHVSCQMSINNIGYPWHHYLCLGCNLRNTKKETIMTIILYIFLTIFLQERLFNTKLMSIFHRTLIFKEFDCAIMLESVPGTNPVLANEGNVSCSRKQQEPLMELTLTSNQIRVRPCYPLLNCITSPLWFYKHRA